MNHTVTDVYTEGSSLSVDFKSTLSTYIHTNMFLQVANIKSSSVESLTINPAANQAVVRYHGNAQPYLYNNIDFSAIYDMMYKEVESIGRWVNTNLKQNDKVSCYTV